MAISRPLLYQTANTWTGSPLVAPYTTRTSPGLHPPPLPPSLSFSFNQIVLFLFKNSRIPNLFFKNKTTLIDRKMKREEKKKEKGRKGRYWPFVQKKEEEEKRRGEGRLPIFAGVSSRKKRGRGWPVYRGDVIRKHAGSTNLSRGREGWWCGASNLVQRNEFSTRSSPCAVPLHPLADHPQGFILSPFPLEPFRDLSLSLF